MRIDPALLPPPITTTPAHTVLPLSPDWYKWLSSKCNFYAISLSPVFASPLLKAPPLTAPEPPDHEMNDNDPIVSPHGRRVLCASFFFLFNALPFSILLCLGTLHSSREVGRG